MGTTVAVLRTTTTEDVELGTEELPYGALPIAEEDGYELTTLDELGALVDELEA